jgi:hypothetical protein
MINFIKFKLQGRSPKWYKFRKSFLSNPKNESCAACKRTKELEVHHILPFDLRPDLELSEPNLITLCKFCHFIFGHFSDYRLYNPEVVNHCRIHQINSFAYKKRIT